MRKTILAIACNMIAMGSTPIAFALCPEDAFVGTYKMVGVICVRGDCPSKDFEGEAVEVSKDSWENGTKVLKFARYARPYQDWQGGWHWSATYANGIKLIEEDILSDSSSDMGIIKQKTFCQEYFDGDKLIRKLGYSWYRTFVPQRAVEIDEFILYQENEKFYVRKQWVDKSEYKPYDDGYMMIIQYKKSTSQTL